jgi:ribosome-associated protein
MAPGDDVAGDLVVNPSLTIPAGELAWRFSRSSGPGGQSVNTTSSRVELQWDAGMSRVLSPAQRRRLVTRVPGAVLEVVAADERSQWQNRRVARERLRAAVLAAITPPPPSRRPTRPSRAAVERRLTAKRRRGEVKRSRRGPRDRAEE